jgi:hypothetical protein
MGDNVMTTITQEKVTDGQIKQITRVATDAADKAVTDYFKGASVSKDGDQRVLANPDFAVRIREVAILALADMSVTDKFKDEEVKSSYGYLSGYKPKGLTEQCNRLRELFSGVGYPNQDLFAQIEKGEAVLPDGAEGWFAIPNVWGSVETFRLFGGGDSFVLQKVLDTIKQTRSGKFYNYRDGELDGDHFRQSTKTEQFFIALSEAQGNPDILIVAPQFGLRHRGRSVRRAREVFALNEFGLGAFATGIMLLTHPERLNNYDDLYIDCAGDEFKPGGGAEFSCAPLFRFHGGLVEFSAHRVGAARGHFGSASVFLPQ